MDQVRFNYKDKSTQVSLFLGMADNISLARQIVINNINDMDLMIDGQIYFGDKVIS